VLKVLFIAESAGIGGAEKITSLMIRYLDRAKFPCEIILGEEGDLVKTYQDWGIPCTVLKMPRPRPISVQIGRFNIPNPLGILGSIFSGFGCIYRLSSFLKQHSFDIIHTSSLLAEIFGSPAWFLSGRKGRLIWHIHNIQPPGFRRWMHTVMARIFPSRLICVSEATAEPYRKSQKDIRVIYNAIAPITERSTFDIGHELGIDKNTFIISLVGRICHQKGQLCLVEASEILVRQVINVKFIIVGSSSESEPTAYEKNLREVIQKKGLEKCFVFTGVRNDAAQIIEQSDILVAPATGPDTLPTVISEAMRAGRPVIATNTGGQPEMVEDGKSGFIIEPGRPDILAEKMKILIENPEMRKEMGQRGREIFLEKFTHDRFIKEIESIYEEQ
jgi:glycosyltransferase involved in cell wall biosynthesis